MNTQLICFLGGVSVTTVILAPGACGLGLRAALLDTTSPESGSPVVPVAVFQTGHFCAQASHLRALGPRRIGSRELLGHSEPLGSLWETLGNFWSIWGSSWRAPGEVWGDSGSFLGDSGGAPGELWEAPLYKTNSRSTAPADVMLSIIFY